MDQNGIGESQVPKDNFTQALVKAALRHTDTQQLIVRPTEGQVGQDLATCQSRTSRQDSQHTDLLSNTKWSALSQYKQQYTDSAAYSWGYLRTGHTDTCMQ